MADAYNEIAEDTSVDDQEIRDTTSYGGDEKNKYLIFLLRLIPISKFQPTSDVSDLVPLYLGVIDSLITMFAFISNVVVVLLYTFVSMFWHDYVPNAAVGVYKWLSFVLAVLWLCINPCCSGGKYFLLWSAVQMRGGKKAIFWLVYLFLSLFFDVIILCFAIGAPASVGFSQLIEIGKSMSVWFFPIIVFIFLLWQTCVWVVVVTWNLVCCFVVMIKIGFVIKNSVRNKV